MPTWLWAGPLLLLVGLGAGLFLAGGPSPGRASTPPAPATMAGLPPAPELPEGDLPAAPATAPAAAAATEAPVDAPEFDAPPTALPADLIAATPTRSAAPAPRTVEDVVGWASDAVVMVETRDGRGSGFFVQADLLVTNAHVVGSETSVMLHLADGSKRPAQVERAAPDVDLAILRTARPATAPPVLQLGAASAVRPGQEVIAIGSALGLQNTVTRGIVSARRMAGPVLLLQTDAAINPGNSGGPLLDREGRVVGVNTMKLTGRAEGLGFAVAIEHAQALVAGRPSAVALTPAGRSSTPGAMPSLAAPSAADQRRDAGARDYARVLEALARRAAQIDDYWQRFRAACGGTLPLPGGDREWFGLLERTPAYSAADPQCGSWIADLQEMAASVRAELRTAADAARRADVYPGTLRDLRRRYRMDWSGWER